MFITLEVLKNKVSRTVKTIVTGTELGCKEDLCVRASRRPSLVKRLTSNVIPTECQFNAGLRHILRLLLASSPASPNLLCIGFVLLHYASCFRCETSY